MPFDGRRRGVAARSLLYHKFQQVTDLLNTIHELSSELSQLKLCYLQDMDNHLRRVEDLEKKNMHYRLELDDLKLKLRESKDAPDDAGGRAPYQNDRAAGRRGG